ncbi:uncharacterized protein RCC_04956 [Ramularia collo-cygni]|uniref:SCD domain-containing protein n=1 Tax=Ramularia collo-cygni TaxID=112498 RepID=A0A2D3V0V2_9PEZI|nr:uncharacterized protein RCC_04956 [Ramularia collo-cygni]CZT19110.1 uncharacterized protein RCC_04956 [Ramularia collo-cygni]
MESPASSAADASVAPRASARVRRAPEHFVTSTFTANGKRKRPGNDGADGDVDMDEDDAEAEEESEEDDDPEDDEPAEEELRERAKRARKPKSTAVKGAASKKPAQKKSKTNGLTLPIRGTVKAAPKKRIPKKAKVLDEADAEAAGGLYADLFAHDKTIDEVVKEWLAAFEEHESRALADVINFVLKSAGCNGKLTEFDIEDPDGATARLTDLQDEHQATEPTDYPLIAKGKTGGNFKQSVTGFLHRLTKAIGASGLLTSNPQLMENIEVWLSTMSTASNRSFRHTAAVASLSVITALCEVARELVDQTANLKRSADAERKKARANKERVKDFDRKAEEASANLEFTEERLRDWFETIFIHRYRDIDPAVRRDCVAALGDWIIIMPDTFFDGHHLRYLGWLLSDDSGATRLEVVHQLQRLYNDSDKFGGLKTFTERFRTRFVEMGTSDVDLNVRVASIELLGVLRNNDLLEPDDIDAVGRLVFHEESRVRKAVGGFFSENVNDLYDSKVIDLEGLEALEELLPDANENNFEAPRLAWLKFKSLAEVLLSYDHHDQIPNQLQRSDADGSLILLAAGTESRFTLAVDALYDKISELKDWQALAGYLLFDHSEGRPHASTSDTLSSLKHECTLSESEEMTLLEVLNACLKRSLTDLADAITTAKGKGKASKKDELQDDLEEAVRNLSDMLPKLLKKFGDSPGTAAAVLRLEGVFGLPLLQSLRQDPTSNNALLDDLRKQIMSHSTDEVLAPAATAILHAKSYGELDDTAMEKLSALWDDVVGNLAELLNVDVIEVRGASSIQELEALSNNLLRIIRLSQVASCILPLEDSAVSGTNAAVDKEYSGPIDFIIGLILRATHSNGPSPDPQEATLEDLVAARACEAALFYTRWKLLEICESIQAGTNSSEAYESLEALATRRDTLATNIAAVLDSRKTKDQISLVMAASILDLYTASASLRTQTARPGTSDDYTALVMDMDTQHENAVMKVFIAHEKEFARLSGKKLEGATIEEADEDVDADPIDDDPVSDSESEDEATQTQTQDAQRSRDLKLMKPLIAEQKLCALAGKLALAITAGVIDDKTTRKRFERNRTKLGPNFRECVAYLDTSAVSKKQTGKSKSAKLNGKAAPRKAKANAKSTALVVDDIEDGVDEIEDEDAGAQPDVEEDEDVINAEPLDEEMNGAD